MKPRRETGPKIVDNIATLHLSILFYQEGEFYRICSPSPFYFDGREPHLNTVLATFDQSLDRLKNIFFAVIRAEEIKKSGIIKVLKKKKLQFRTKFV